MYSMRPKPGRWTAPVKPSKPYEYLLPLAAKEPTERVRGAALFYAEKLGKDDKTVRADIRAVLDEDAEEIKDYSFERYDNGERVSLSDYRGKVRAPELLVPVLWALPGRES